MVAQSTNKVAQGKRAPADDELLAALQERMDRLAKGDAPNSGRFCGYCFARLNAGETICSVCRRSAHAHPPAESVPREVLLVYRAHYKKMSLWVNVFAFVGMFIAIVLAGLIVAFFAPAAKLLAIPVLLGGAWYFANLLGGGVGGYAGNRAGATARARRWAAYQAARGLPVSAAD